MHRPIVLPAIANGVEGLEPRVAAVCDASRIADENPVLRGDDAIEGDTSRLRVEPVDRTADGDDVERAKARGHVLEASLDECRRCPRASGRGAGRLDHCGLRIDADDLAASGREADRE